MAQMMQIIMRIAREKGTVDDAGFMNTVARTQGITKGLVNPPANPINLEAGFSHHSIIPLTNVNPEIYPSPLTPMPLGGVYTYIYMPLPIIPNPLITQVDGNLATIFTQVFIVVKLRRIEEAKEEEIRNDDAI